MCLQNSSNLMRRSVLYFYLVPTGTRDDRSALGNRQSIASAVRCDPSPSEPLAEPALCSTGPPRAKKVSYSLRRFRVRPAG